MAKEELDKMAEKAYAKDIQYIGMSANITYKLGFKAGYDKANEWHYVKDGDLPKHENYVLISNGKDWTKGFYKDKRWSVIHLVGFTQIIMWKEIVLPELKEK